MTYYPSIEDVISAHGRLIERFGGAAGLRDRAALARPQTGYYADLIQEAAALWESLSQNHPFLDGNKRTAVTVMAAFLRSTVTSWKFDDIAAFKFLMELYENRKFRVGELEGWLREHASPLR